MTGYKSGKRVSRRFLWPALICLTLVPSPGGAGFFQRASDPSGFSRLELVQHALRERVGLETPGASRVCGEAVLAPDLLRLFYAQRESRPAWSGEAEIWPQVRGLLQALKNVFGEGLDPSDYHLIAIEEQSNRIEKALKKKRPLPPEILAEFDMLCSDAFLSCAGHLLGGKVDPETHQAAWQGACLEEGLAGLMERALVEDGVPEALSSLAPKHSFYLNLKKALSSYRRLAQKTEWTPFSEGLTLKRGDKRKEVKELGKRLRALGDFDDSRRKPGRDFDSALEEALRRFQTRHGLESSGFLDAPTLAAVKIPLEERCRQIEANLERWRWLPHGLWERFIYVNVADFRLEAFEGGRKKLAMKVVVGSEAWQTPDFASQMTQLVVNPGWTIPIPVILKETVNYVLQNPCYFRDNRMVILRKQGDETVELDPASIDWAKLTEKNLDFLIRQLPGPDNILGRLKFVFPNKYDIFLHDTPYQADFAKSARAFSHGCIRAERPADLAVWVLRGKPGWDLRQIWAAVDAGQERTVKLAEPLDVIFLYNTAWAEDDGVVHFRPDIYERDKKLIEALTTKRASASGYGWGRGPGG